MNITKYYSFSNINDNMTDLYIFGDIVSYQWDENDVSSFGFKKDLEALGDVSEINVHINSYGGSTFEGLAIYNLLKQHKAKINVYIDGIAASAASVIAMAGDKIYMPKTSLMMIHNCWTWTEGNAKELRKTADDMDKIAVAYKEAYMSKVNIKENKLDKLLDEETYLTADECIEMGFADEIIEQDEDKAVNQHANRCIMKLVNKVKQKEKENTSIASLDKKTMEEITDKIADRISEKLTKEKEEKKDNNQNQDALLASFLNNFLK